MTTATCTKCGNTFVKRNNCHKYCEKCCPNRKEYMREYRKKHGRNAKYKGKPNWDVTWYRQYRNKYSTQIEAIPYNQWMEVKAVEPTYCEAVEKFFGLNGPPMKLKDINEGNRRRNYRHIRIVLCYFHIITPTLKSNAIANGVRRLTGKIKQYRINNKIALNKQRMANTLGLKHFPQNGERVNIDDDEIYLVGRSILGCNNLKEREKYALQTRYGMDVTGVTKSYSAIGAQLGISTECARQILHDSLRKLGHPQLRF